MTICDNDGHQDKSAEHQQSAARSSHDKPERRHRSCAHRQRLGEKSARLKLSSLSSLSSSLLAFCLAPQFDRVDLRKALSALVNEPQHGSQECNRGEEPFYDAVHVAVLDKANRVKE